MRNFLTTIYFSFKSMPLLLRCITCLCLSGICFVGTIFPFFTFSIGGKEVTYSEFWASGVGVEAFLLGILLFTTGIGIYQRQEWSRGLFVLVTIVYSVIIPTLHQNIPMNNEIVGLMIWFALLIWYLFFKKSVKDYYNDESRGRKIMINIKSFL